MKGAEGWCVASNRGRNHLAIYSVTTSPGSIGRRNVSRSTLTLTSCFECFMDVRVPPSVPSSTPRSLSPRNGSVVGRRTSRLRPGLR